MGKIVDNVIAMRVLWMLVTPFQNTDAFKLGLIDKDGNRLRDPRTSREQDAYTALHRLVFNLKRLLGKVPGGKSKLASIAAALWLIKASYERDLDPTQTDLDLLVDEVESGEIKLVVEQVQIRQFVELYEEGGGAGGAGAGAVAAAGPAPAGSIANVTGKGVSTDQPAVRLNKKKRPVTGIIGAPDYMVRRQVKKLPMGQG